MANGEINVTERHNRHDSRHRYLLFFLGGPAGITVVMLADTITAVGAWVYHGQPDFAFRGAQGVELSLVFAVAAGMFLGWIFGGGLVLYEILTGKYVPPLRLMAVMETLALVFFGLTNWISISREEWLLTPPISQLVVLGGVMIAVMAVSRDERSQ